jgi:hypothetical protein
MAGLPKKYAKMGFAKGWKAYRAAKRKRKSPAKPKRKTTTRRRTQPMARKRKTSRRRRTARKVARGLYTNPAVRGVGRKTTKAIINTGIGVGGAVGTAAVINMMPIQDSRAKALTQLAIGMGMLALTPKNAIMLKVAGGGASLAGALALVKASGMPLPLLAGEGMGVNLQYMGANPYKKIATQAARASTPAVSPFMGLNTEYRSNGRMMGRGYGSRFVTQANM